MGRVGTARLSVLFAAAVVGCNMITGVDQLERVDGLGGDTSTPTPDATAPDPGSDGGQFSDARVHGLEEASASVDSAPQPFDAGTADAGATVCQGLTTLWRFDGKAASSQGDAPKNSPNIDYGAGKFSWGLSLPNSDQYLEYNAQRGATSIVLPTQGTVSMWIKNADGHWTYPCHDNHAFFAFDYDGMWMDCEDTGLLGLWLETGSNTRIGAALVAQNGRWTNDYNHLVATWSQSPPSMGIVLNASVTNMTTDWTTPPHSSVTTFLLSYPNAPMNVFLDDVAIWDRPLTNAEIATVYGAGKSIGDVCGLP
jgi:hypothetical protein